MSNLFRGLQYNEKQAEDPNKTYIHDVKTYNTRKKPIHPKVNINHIRTLHQHCGIILMLYLSCVSLLFDSQVI